MLIIFTSKKMEKLCNEEKTAIRILGKEMAHKLFLRIQQLEAAPDMSEIPPMARCHPLIGNEAGKYAVDLIQPYRLIFYPANTPLPLNAAGVLEINKVTEIIIDKIIDYH